jgi:hypothetical protein
MRLLLKLWESTQRRFIALAHFMRPRSAAAARRRSAIAFSSTSSPAEQALVDVSADADRVRNDAPLPARRARQAHPLRRVVDADVGQAIRQQEAPPDVSGAQVRGQLAAARRTAAVEVRRTARVDAGQLCQRVPAGLGRRLHRLHHRLDLVVIGDERLAALFRRSFRGGDGDEGVADNVPGAANEMAVDADGAVHWALLPGGGGARMVVARLRLPELGIRGGV